MSDLKCTDTFKIHPYQQYVSHFDPIKELANEIELLPEQDQKKIWKFINNEYLKLQLDQMSESFGQLDIQRINETDIPEKIRAFIATIIRQNTVDEIVNSSDDDIKHVWEEHREYAKSFNYRKYAKYNFSKIHNC